ncbi:hypothetical protein B0H65DRAFT_548102 [Neurospora tetraspora]|uniref:Uncharacterized protein n=1 Tax=Neurospora tetraspora TaxID=94610 RepID=A0AAE0MT81_9PEZI|nr:hypothetical protein B0H65DRAFT_548102 [Neurospora tetraspora]
MSQDQRDQSAPASPKEPRFEPKPLTLVLWNGPDERKQVLTIEQHYVKWRIFFTTLVHNSTPWEELTAYDLHVLLDLSACRAPKNAQFVSTKGFCTQEEVEEKEKATEEILTELGFRNLKTTAKGQSFSLEMKWPFPKGQPVADVDQLNDDFWERFKKPASSKAVTQATSESESVAGEDGKQVVNQDVTEKQVGEEET